MDTITGLPAHPLLVHFPVVAIPLAAILVVLFVLVPSWRSVLDYLLVGMGGAIAISVVLAASTGEALQEEVDKSSALSSHVQLGDQMQTIGVLFGAALIALGLYHLLSARQVVQFGANIERPLMLGLMAGTILVGSVAVVWVVRTGHSGAKASWSEKVGSEQADSGNGDEASVIVQDAASRAVLGIRSGGS